MIPNFCCELWPSVFIATPPITFVGVNAAGVGLHGTETISFVWSKVYCGKFAVVGFSVTGGVVIGSVVTGGVVTGGVVTGHPVKVFGGVFTPVKASAYILVTAFANSGFDFISLAFFFIKSIALFFHIVLIFSVTMFICSGVYTILSNN